MPIGGDCEAILVNSKRKGLAQQLSGGSSVPTFRTQAMSSRTYTGNCHCGAIRFEVLAEPDIEALAIIGGNAGDRP